MKPFKQCRCGAYTARSKCDTCRRKEQEAIMQKKLERMVEREKSAKKNSYA